MQYIAALDGLRAVAVLLVMAFHAHAPLAGGGYIGVDIFFVLSGFLITNILLAEHARTSQINFKSFYLRRLLRLTPALFMMLFIYLIFAPYAWPLYEDHLRDAFITAVYLSDYSRAIWQIPDMLRHTWSLSVEMHFYLIWPLIIMLIYRKKVRNPLFIFMALYVVATAWRLLSTGSESWPRIYYGFDTRISGFIMGAVVAVFAQTQKRLFVWPELAVAILSIAAIVFLSHWEQVEVLQFGVVIVEIGTAVLILSILQQGRFSELMSWPLLTYIGRLSYGLYLFHYPIMLYLRPSHAWWVTLGAGSVSALILAALTYHLVESRVKVWRSIASSYAAGKQQPML